MEFRHCPGTTHTNTDALSRVQTTIRAKTTVCQIVHTSTDRDPNFLSIFSGLVNPELQTTDAEVKGYITTVTEVHIDKELLKSFAQELPSDQTFGKLYRKMLVRL